MFTSQALSYVYRILDVLLGSRPSTSSLVTEQKPPSELKTTYLQNEAVGTEAEYERLNSIHNAIRGIQNGALSWVSLENPKSILDMGCGSAAWAIQAAETFPEAEILAVDIIPKPNRRFPDNLKYQQVNLCEPLPPQFKPKTFDTIHARLLFVHLPGYKEILQKTVEMLKSGGWLFITDIVTVPYGIRNPLPPNLQRYFEGRANMIASTGGTPHIGQELGVVLNSFPELIEVNVKKLVIPVSQWQDESLDPALRELAAIMRRSLVFGIKSAPQFGLSEEEVIQDLDNPDNDIHFAQPLPPKALRVLLPTTVLLGLSYYAHNVIFDILFPYVSNLNPTPVNPCPAEYDGSSMYRREYFGGLMPSLERSLCPLVAFFYPVVQPDVKPHYYREFMIASFSNLSVIVCATFVEASRMQRGLIGPFWILLPVLTGIVYQFITGAVTLPFFWTIVIVAQRQGLIKSARIIDERDGEGIALGMVLGYVIPTYLMLFHSDIPSVVAWQIFPVIVGAVCWIYILLHPRSNKPPRYNNATQTTYGALFISLTLINFYFIISNNFNLAKLIDIWLPPFTFQLKPTIQTFADFSAIILQWDLMLIFGGTYLASLWFAKDIKQVLAIVAWYVGPGLLLGPGPAIAAVLMWREGELEKQNEKVKGE